MEGNMVSFLAVLTAFIIVTVMAGKSEWNQKARDHILDIHNEYRRNEGGCQINKLVYDMELEAQAKTWAEKCIFKHEDKAGRGENLAYRTYHDPELEMISASSKAWFDEKEHYTVGQHDCEMTEACHYTQLVWDVTQKVGCYTTRCPFLKGTKKITRNAWNLVCFYTPRGNTVGRKMYKTECETPCRAGQTEENGLCVGDMPCVNKNRSCKGWAKRGECQRSKNYMKEYCKKACGLCH